MLGDIAPVFWPYRAHRKWAVLLVGRNAGLGFSGVWAMGVCKYDAQSNHPEGAAEAGPMAPVMMAMPSAGLETSSVRFKKKAALS